MIKSELIKKINSSKKFFLVLTVILFSLVSVFSEPFFSGLAGGTFDYYTDAEDKTGNLTLNAFLSGQLDFTKNTVVRFGFALNTENIFGENFLTKIPSLFTVDELSVNYHANLGDLSHYVSAFAGTPEPLGSSIFLQRLFGMPDFSAKMLETTGNPTKNAIIPLSGIGADYVLKTKHTAFGVYLYYNKIISLIDPKTTEAAVPDLGSPLPGTPQTENEEITSGEKKATSLDLDLRFAAGGNYAFLDFLGGISFPFDNQDDSGEDVILIVRKANFHMGFNFFLGSTYMTNLLFQAGITSLEINPDEDEEIIALKDVYWYIEPRFVTRKLCFAIALFNIPEELNRNLYFIDNPFGVNVSVYTNNLSFNNYKTEIGCHITASLPETTTDIDYKLLELQVAPYVKIDLGNGTFKTVLKSEVLHITSFKNAMMNLKFAAGYQVKL